MIGRDIERTESESIIPHREEKTVCPTIENWPDDEFSRWVASHRDEVRTLVCSSVYYESMAACRS